MRRNAFFLFGVLLAVAGARDAYALTACTAAQVSSQDSGCPSGAGPCSIISTFGGVQDVGGLVFFQAAGIVDVGSAIDVHGGEGGEFDIIAGGAVTLRQTVDAGANGDAGFGGTVDITGSKVDLLGDIEL